MATVKQEYNNIRITGSKVHLQRADGTEDTIRIENLDTFDVSGPISNGEGDQDFFDANPQGSEPDSTIIIIAREWRNTYIDFNAARGQMGVELATAGGFSALTDYQKKIVSRWFLAASEDRLTVITLDEDKANWEFLTEETLIARKARLEAARRKMSFFLFPDNSDDLYDDVQTLFDAYQTANKTDIIDYINNTPGSAYESNGFAQKGYYSDELKDIFNDVVVNGTY